jgi:hypothetical protein
MKRLCRYDANHELFRCCDLFDLNCLHSSTVATAVMQCVFHVIFVGMCWEHQGSSTEDWRYCEL